MLTELAIRKAKGTAKVQKLFDGGGLYLEVPPKGNKRWRLKYRYQGKEKLISLGLYPAITLAEARVRRDEAKKLLAHGIDPSAERQATQAAQFASESGRFEIVAREWFSKFQSQWVEKNVKVNMQRLEGHVFPWLGDRPIEAITASEVLEVLNRIVNRGRIDSAHRVRNLISQIFRYGIATNRVSQDVTVVLVGALPPAQERHFAAITDPKRLGQVLRMFDAYPGGLVVCCALKLTPLLFVRPGELRTMQWVDVDLEAKEWKFTLSKTKQTHIVPLATQAITILKEIQPLTGRGRYVFPCAGKHSRPMSNCAVVSALRAMNLDSDEVTAHGFRATARTLLDEVLKYRPDWIEAQLGHTVRDPLGRAYNRTTHLDERREMMQAWADYLDKLKGDI